MRKLAAVTITVLLAIAALAVDVRAIGGAVYVNESRIMAFGDQKRATAVAEQLRRAGNLVPISVQTQGTSASLIAGKVSVQASRSDASGAGMTPVELASEWADRLKEALRLPPIQVPGKTHQVGIGGEGFFSIVGTEAAKASVTSSNPTIARVEKVPLGMRVRGVGKGRATIRIKSGTNTITAQVQVLPLAANLPQTVTATVVGDPATGETIRSAVENAAQQQLKASPGASVEVLDSRFQSLAQGSNVALQTKIRVTAPNSVPTTGTISVRVSNSTLAHRKETELWYCNDPENVMGPGNLFAAELKEQSPARMLYHHTNASSEPLVVQVLATNIYDTPLKLVIIPGDGVPHKDPVRVGLEAGERFVRNWLSGSGEIITIPPRSSIPIAMRRIAPAETMSGLCYLRLLQGSASKMLIRTDAVDPRFMDAGWATATNLATPWSKAGPRRIGEAAILPPLTNHIYPHPFKVVESTYEVGGRFAFVWVGQKPIPSSDGDLHLDGNFGVLYTLKLKMTNPTDRATNVEVVFEASAGYSGAVFVVNNQLQRAPVIQSKAEYVVRKMTLPAGGSQDLTLMTVPLSGSSYPALFTVRQAGLGIR
ncbi:MAG TPA: hypothetical protein PLL78_02115 [Fimbriimonadaceae bacterium]|nr:hypothetical protein [Fimbriimonadaceae bacterium]HRJ95454.1 hypothetical protein [Fimbriimonadaceae bacterium]